MSGTLKPWVASHPVGVFKHTHTRPFFFFLPIRSLPWPVTWSHMSQAHLLLAPGHIVLIPHPSLLRPLLCASPPASPCTPCKRQIGLHRVWRPGPVQPPGLASPSPLLEGLPPPQLPAPCSLAFHISLSLPCLFVFGLVTRSAGLLMTGSLTFLFFPSFKASEKASHRNRDDNIASRISKFTRYFRLHPLIGDCKYSVENGVALKW